MGNEQQQNKSCKKNKNLLGISILHLIWIDLFFHTHLQISKTPSHQEKVGSVVKRRLGHCWSSFVAC